MIYNNRNEYVSWILSPKDLLFARPAKFDCANVFSIPTPTMRLALMALTNSTYHNNRESWVTSLYLEVSIFMVSKRLVCVVPPTAALNCCYLNCSVCWAPSFLNALLVKQGYFLSFGDKFILNKPGYNVMLLVYAKRLQHCDKGRSNTVERKRSTSLHLISLKLS